MTVTKYKLIQKFAYSYWDKAGRPEGRDLEFWSKAEKHVEYIRAWQKAMEWSFEEDIQHCDDRREGRSYLKYGDAEETN